MQKQLLFLCIFSVLVLSGCSQQSHIQDAQIVQTAIQQSFMYWNVFSLVDKNPFSDSGIVRESFGLYSNTVSDTIVSDIELAITTDSTGSTLFSSMVFSWYLEDISHDDIFTWSGTINSIILQDKQYINREDGYIDLWSWNAESFVVRILLDAIKAQWMLVDEDGLINTELLNPLNGSKIIGILHTIKNIVTDSWSMTPTPSSIAGLYPVAFNLSWYTSHLASLYTLLDKDPSSIDLSLIGSIQTIPEPRLIIDNMEDRNSDRSMSGYVGVKYGYLMFDMTDHIWHINWQEKKNSVYLEIRIEDREKELVWLQLTITPKSLDNSLWSLAYEWDIRFALWSNNLITFPIAGLYGIYIVDATQFIEPTRYILMSQLFGDEYGIARILESQ